MDEIKKSSSIEEIALLLESLLIDTLKTERFELQLTDAYLSKKLPPTIDRKAFFRPISNETVSMYAKHDNLIFLNESENIETPSPTPYNFDIAIPLKATSGGIGALLFQAPNRIGFYNRDNISILLRLKSELGDVIDRVIHTQSMTHELNDARKILSVLNIANQYHHDLKTPLAIIDGVISTDIYDEAKRREIVIEQVKRGSQLIATMANMLKEKRERKITTIDLGQTLERSAFLFESSFDHMNIHIADTCHIGGDAVDLTILFSNIIKNAAEAASKERENTLTIILSKNPSHARIEIRDSGEGMNEEKQAELWQLTSSKKTDGNAIGLQAVKRIAEEHNIIIQVESTPDKGSAFFLSCPLISKEQITPHHAVEENK